MPGVAQTLEDRSTVFTGPALRRRLWWIVHSWVGLKLSLFMTWVLLTGTFAVFAVEMDWLARPALRVDPQYAPHVSWGSMAAAAAAAMPEGRVTTIYAPPHAWFAADAIAEVGADDRKRIYINPYDGRVQGVGPWMSFQRFFREMHRHLLLPARYGIPIVCSLSILLLLSIVIYSVRLKKAYASDRALHPSGSSWLARAWHGMGSWGYVGGGIVLLSLALIPGWLA